jgi:hypothetical protein
MRTPTMTDLAITLEAAVDEESMRTQITEALITVEERASQMRALDLRAIALEALLIVCHENRSEVLVGELAELGNGVLAMRQEQANFTPRQFGALLHELGLSTAKLGSQGRGVRLDNAIRAQVHQAAGYYDVDAPIRSECRDCAQYRNLRQAA